MLARFSQNPHFSKIHRQKFSLNEGVISKAWQHGDHHDDKCPSYEGNAADYTQYVRETYGYRDDTINCLHMKSCRYLAVAVIDADVHIGAIVFESTNSEFFNTKDVENRTEKIKRVCREHQSQISKFVRDALSFDKEINAKREGRTVSVENEVLKLLEEEIV